jgi:hypothetical protein
MDAHDAVKVALSCPVAATGGAKHSSDMMFGRFWSLLSLVVLALCMMPGAAHADEYEFPYPKTYVSTSGQVRAIVSPRISEDMVREDGDAVGAKGQRLVSTAAATARVERRNGKGWDTLWERPLLNDVGPSHALVRDDGFYLVTFDDWYSRGYGPHAVVIHGRDGQSVRTMALTDIVPRAWFEALPRSMSAVNWRRHPRFSADGQAVIIPLVVPGKKDINVDVAIGLADGRVAPVDASGWQDALAAATKERAKIAASEAERKAAFLAPLLGPATNTEQAWHRYLDEAVQRIMPPKVEERREEAGKVTVVRTDTATTTVLRQPGAKDYAISESRIAKEFAEDWTDHMALASLSEPQLLVVLRKLTAGMPKGRLKKKTIFVAVSAPLWPQVRAIMQHTGATLVHLDSGKPIPQRTERIADRYPQ